jgi:hypothetical protein
LLMTWLVSLRSDEASPYLTCGMLTNCLACIIAMSQVLL